LWTDVYSSYIIHSTGDVSVWCI